jgi:hypothetical protein
MTALSSHTLLTTALVGALLPPDVPEGDMLRGWLDSWSGGVGHVLDAMTAAGHHVELRQSVFGWRAEFHREAVCVRVDLHHHTEGLDSEQLLPQAFEIRSQLCYLHVLVPVVRERESVTVLPIDRPA